MVVLPFVPVTPTSESPTRRIAVQERRGMRRGRTRVGHNELGNIRVRLGLFDQGRDRSRGRGPCDELVSVELGPAQCTEEDPRLHLPGVRDNAGEPGRWVSLPPRGQPALLQSAFELLSLYHTRIRFGVPVAPGLGDTDRWSSVHVNAGELSRRERRAFLLAGSCRVTRPDPLRLDTQAQSVKPGNGHPRLESLSGRAS